MATNPRTKAGHLDDVLAAGAALVAAERALFVAVCCARQNSKRPGYLHPEVTWDDIAGELGVTKQAAAKRFAGWRYDERTDQLICERRLR